MKKAYCLALIFLIIFPFSAMGAQRGSMKEGKDIAAEWYFPEWLGTSPFAPSFEVRDTVNKYGRYAKETKTMTLKDLIKFHGHFSGAWWKARLL